MSDRYSQIVNAPVVSTVAKQLGLPQPVSLDRYEPGAPVVSGPVLSGAAPGGRLGKALPAFLDSIKAERAGAEGRAKALRLRRHRHRRLDRAGRAAALLPPGRGTAAAQRPRRRDRHTAGRSRLRPRSHRPAGAGGLHPLARQGDRRPRLDRAAGLRRRRRRGPARLDPALPALAALGLRLRPGGADRRRRRADPGDRVGAPARRQGGAGHRRLARDRRRDRRHPRPRRRQGGRPRRAAGRRRSARRHRGDRRRPSNRHRHHRRGRSRADRRAPLRRRRRRRPQRRRYQGPHDREDARRALGAAAGDQPLQRGADQRRPARRRAAAAERPHRRRLLDGRDRRQQRPDQLRRLEGGRDRDGRIAGAGAGQPAERRSTPSPPASSRRR